MISSKRGKKKKLRSLLEHMKIQQFVFEFPRPLILPDHQIFRSSDVPVHNLLSFCVIRKEKQKIFMGDQVVHGLRTPGEEIAFTERPKIHSHSQIFRQAEEYFVCHIGPNFQISLIYAFIGCPQSVAILYMQQYQHKQTLDWGILEFPGV